MEFRVVATAVAVLATSTLNGGQHNVAATSDIRELAISQIIGGAKIVVPIEVASDANGELYFRIGPFLPQHPLLADYVIPEAPNTILQASSQ